MEIGISLNASEKEIEFAFNAFMKVPLLYQRTYFQSTSIYPEVYAIPTEDQSCIYPMELGLAPTDCEEIEDYRFHNPNSCFFERKKFFENEILVSESKTCLIILSGMILPIKAWKSSKIYPFHTKPDGSKFLVVAGIYNEIRPGYYTTAMITKSKMECSPLFAKFDCPEIPFVINDKCASDWLKAKSISERIHTLSYAFNVKRFTGYNLRLDLFSREENMNRRSSLNRRSS